MKGIWGEEKKFELWLELELKVLHARAKLHRIDRQIPKRIQSQAKFDVPTIKAIDREIEHDLLAFVECVRRSLNPELRRHFHEGMTSFDTEEIPAAVTVVNALDVVSSAVSTLQEAIISRAREHKGTVMIDGARDKTPYYLIEY